MPPRFSYKNDSDEDKRANPQENARRLQEQERQSSYENAGTDQAEAFANDPANASSGINNTANIDAVRDKEEGGSWDNNVSSSFGGNKNTGSGGKTSFNIRAVLKKRGPLAAIIAILFGGGITGALLFSPGLILVQMKESLTDRFNTQLASMDSRSTRILYTKVRGATSGICGATITIKCKYSTLSEKQAANLKKAGIDIEGEAKFGNRVKPTSYVFKGQSISASDFATRATTDNELKTALRKAYNPKYMGFADSAWSKVATKLGITKQRALPDGDDAAKTKALNDEVKNGKKIDISNDGVTCDENDKCTRKDANGKEVELSDSEKASRRAAIAASSEAAADTAESATESVISKTTGAGFSAVGNFIKVTGPVDTVCSAYTAVKGLGYAAKTIRAVQLARYAMVFINTADQIKAGTAKPEDVAYLGGILTNVAYDANGAVKRKAAMDSAGMQYSMFGDTSGFSGKAGSYASQFMAGGGLTGDLIAITSYIDKEFSVLGVANPENTCKTLSNGWVQMGSAAAGIALMFIPGVNVAITAADIAKAGMSVSVSVMLAVLPSMLKDIVAGNTTKGIVGEDSGNAIASGFGVISSQTAQAGGNAPMSVDDALAYTNLNNEVVASYSNDEAQSLSPLDATNKDTFIGSIVNKLLPFVSSTGSIGNPLYALSTLTSSSLSSILPAASALSTEQQKAALSVCNDPDYKEMGVATDPFCNLVVGIPPQYLNRDPIEVANALEGQYNEETGEPVDKSPYKSYVDDCINRSAPIGSTGDDGKTDNGAKCKITSENANYYLFYMDQRVDTDMDGFSDDSSGSSTDTTDTTTGSSTDPDNSTDQGVIINSLTAFYSPSTRQQTADVAVNSAVQSQKNQLNLGWYWTVA